MLTNVSRNFDPTFTVKLPMHSVDSAQKKSIPKQAGRTDILVPSTRKKDTCAESEEGSEKRAGRTDILVPSIRREDAGHPTHKTTRKKTGCWKPIAK